MKVVTKVRTGKSWMSRPALLVVALITCACAFALSTFDVDNARATTTFNKWVGATVSDDGYGLLSMYGFPGDPGFNNYSLSYPNESFLTLLLDNNVYTNNTVGGEQPAPKGILNNGVTTKFGSGSGPDTIRTVWNINGVELIQDVYPVEYEKSGQIVLRLSLNNKTISPVNAQVQFLLDLQVDGNDGDTVLTRWGYDPYWSQFPSSGGGRGVPPFYIAFQNGLPQKTIPQFPKNGTGWFDKPELGLIIPSQVTIGHWPAFINSSWGPPATIPTNQAYTDNAILMMFPPTGASPGHSVELGRTSYGNGEFDICSNSLFSITFYPHKIKYDPVLKQLSPNPFTVESLIFNSSDNTSASNMSATLTVGPDLTILSPTPVVGNTQSHATFPTTVLPLDVADVTWSVQADRPTVCAGDIDSYINLAVIATGGFAPGVGTCDMPLTIECAPTDVDPPAADQATGTSVQDSAFAVHDKRVTDLGLKTITWNVSSGTASNFTITTNPGLPLLNCPKSDVVVSVHQIDSTQGGCIDFQYTDCANNQSTSTLCFKSRPTHIIPDTLRPVFHVFGKYHWPTIDSVLDSSIDCHAQCDSMFVTDDALGDRGLRSIDSVPGSAINMRLTVLPFKVGSPLARFSACVIDSLHDGSITVFATDTSGNRTADTTFTYCTVPDTLPPLLTRSNYVNGAWHVHVTDTRPWDRGFGDIQITALTNAVAVPNPTPALIKGLHTVDFDVVVTDTFAEKGFCVLAIDSAGNRHKQFGDCVNNTALEDVWPPNIVPSIPLAQNPYSVDFDVNDNHISLVGDTINYDAGIDSVYFTGVTNMTLIDANGNVYVNNAANPSVTFPALHNPYLGPGHQPFAKTLPIFTIHVSDTAAIDPTACVTIHAVDGRQRVKPGLSNVTTLQWCYPVSLDTSAPVILGTAASHATIDATITDDKTLDRGLRIITLDRSLNFDPINDTLDGTSSTQVTLRVTTPGKSAYGHLSAIDVYGDKLSSIPLREAHTASDSVAIYVENLRMVVDQIILQSGNFDVPVFLDSTTDDVPLAQKQLANYAFSFHLSGSPLVQFVGPTVTGTESATWNTISTTNPDGSFTVTGTAQPAGAFLTDDNLPLLYLRFHGDPAADPTTTSVVIDGAQGSEVTYNGGSDRTIVGSNATLIQPAPYGTLSGGNIVVKGYCSPLISAGGQPTKVTMAPTSPNPAKSTTQVEYTVPNEGPVTLELFNTLGERVREVVNQVQTQGEYHLQLSAQGLAEGTYFLRLEAAGVVLSRRVTISR